MKKLLVFSMVLVSFVSYGQNEGTAIVYSQVIDVPNTPKNELYSGVKQWLASSYKSLNNVSQLDDRESGVFIGKGTMSWTSESFSMGCATGYIDYQIKAQVKDNKLKLELSNFQHKAKVGSVSACSLGLITDKEEYKSGIFSGPYNKIWIQMKDDTKNYFNELLSSLQTTIKTTKKDDF